MSKKKKHIKINKSTEDKADSTESIEENDVSTEDSADDATEDSTPIKSLEELLKESKDELAEQKDKFVRLQAETDNFRKRMTREKNEFSQYANERMLKELIPIFDNFERALDASSTDTKSLKEGLDMILEQFNSFREKENVEPIKSIGEEFDPSIHDALTREESTEHKENIVIREFVKGYMLNGRVLRPTQVVISKTPSEISEENSEEEKTSITE
jgi:molecular chaperone GrpE